MSGAVTPPRAGPDWTPVVAADDLNVLPEHLRRRARVESNGEVQWHVTDAADAIEALASAGRVVHGLDCREYAEDGTFTEVARSDYAGRDAHGSRDAAMAALKERDLPGSWILVTWSSDSSSHDMQAARGKTMISSPIPD